MEALYPRVYKPRRTRLQERYKNATQAAVLAGYSPDSADFIGAKLLRDEQVQDFILAALEKKGIGWDYITDREVKPRSRRSAR